MDKNSERYLDGVFSNYTANYISNVKVFRQAEIKNERLTQNEFWRSTNHGENT